MKIGRERDSLPRLLAFVYAPIGLVAWWLLKHQIMVDVDRLTCPLLEYTGVACPTCGGTRAGLALGRLDLPGAFVENPLIAAGLLLLGVWFLYALVATVLPRLRVTIRLTRGERRFLRAVVVAAILATWTYEILRHA